MSLRKRPSCAALFSNDDLAWIRPVKRLEDQISVEPVEERSRRALGWFGVDVACVLVFCAVGRRSHDEALSVAGIATTAWPFLSGTGLGWLAARAWRRPTAVAPTGLVVWVCTVAVGMLLRKVNSAGVAASFVVVASTVTALLLLGWRAALLLSARKPN
jgi:hypothetical protein